jgi:hypothetical protein
VTIYDQTWYHPANAAYYTRLVIANVSIGVVSYSLTFNRVSTAWLGFNENNAGTDPNATLNGTKTSSTPPVFAFSFASGYYKFDFRSGQEDGAILNKTIASGNWNVTPGVSNSFSGRHYSHSGGGQIDVSGSFTPQGYPAPYWTDLTINTSVVRGVGYYSDISATNYVGSYGVIANPNGFAPGLSFNDNGTITGTPTTTGYYPFTVRAYASGGSIDANLEITVNPATPVFSDSTLSSPAIRGASYSDGVSASETASYSVVASPNNLPPGLTLNTSTGSITGTPTTLGSYSFKIRATNVTASADTPTRTIVVNPPTPIFTVLTVSSDASLGASYSGQITASDATSYSVFSGSLPDGINLNTTTGAISGTPTSPGTFSFVLRATNVTGSVNTSTLTVSIPAVVKIWNGSEFVSNIPKVWNGTAFVDGIVRTWNGSSWVGPK